MRRHALALLLLLANACATERTVRDERPIRANATPGPHVGGPMSGNRMKTGAIDFSNDVSGEPFQEGVASWYGGHYHGRKTANGEVFDVMMYTAAHRTLPLGTWVRVTNVETGAWVDVWVNDRGPYVDGRVIDLSWAAASAIGIVDKGVATVSLSRLRLP